MTKTEYSSLIRWDEYGKTMLELTAQHRNKIPIKIFYCLQLKQLKNAINTQYCFPKIGNFVKKLLSRFPLLEDNNKMHALPNM